ncbi:hypothetical protein NY78_4459 [Desulfovibrio sp. TomC]|nr:hypothetical protein NY78_4459 [Desulfovibrio sp. TomC]
MIIIETPQMLAGGLFCCSGQLQQAVLVDRVGQLRRQAKVPDAA